MSKFLHDDNDDAKATTILRVFTESSRAKNVDLNRRPFKVDVSGVQ